MDNEDKQGLYAAFKSKDSRFDGRFFVGVSSTGIYCRPVCRARLPKIENCTYYTTAAEAEQSGYRPCLLCRPELAPGKSITDATASLVQRAARLLEEHCGSGMSLNELAGRLGCTDRHLRRVFTAEYHVSPVQYLQTCRLLLAKSLLTDTGLPVLEVAMAAGFGSLRRFNDLFRKHYHLSPTELRRQAVRQEGLQNEITLALGYRPPYDWEQILGFLAQRAIPGVEKVENGMYMRTVRIVSDDGSSRNALGGDIVQKQRQAVFGWIRVANWPEHNVLKVTISSALLTVIPQVLARVRHLFDLHCDPDAVAAKLEPMNAIRPGLFRKGLRVPGCFDPYEMAVRAVLGQQITVKAAGTLAARMVSHYGTSVPTGIEGLTHTFPVPGDIIALAPLIEEHLGRLGIIAARSRVILRLAGALDQGEIKFDLGAQPEEQIKRLMEFPGVGAWTAKYIAMRAMGWPDALLDTDLGVKKALAGYKPKEILALADDWHPWCSYATVNLWNSL